MVDIKAAVANAINFARGSLGSERTADIRLEEIESASVDRKAVWLITLSNALIEAGPLASIRAVTASLGAYATREYKTFTVAKESGEVLSMKIRLLATPTAK
jgi:hypothetical protein